MSLLQAPTVYDVLMRAVKEYGSASRAQDRTAAGDAYERILEVAYAAGLQDQPASAVVR